MFLSRSETHYQEINYTGLANDQLTGAIGSSAPILHALLILELAIANPTRLGHAAAENAIETCWSRIATSLILI